MEHFRDKIAGQSGRDVWPWRSNGNRVELRATGKGPFRTSRFGGLHRA